MDRVLGNEDTSNPPLFCDINASELLALNSSRLTPELTLTSSPSPNNGDISDVGSCFNSGRKNKRKLTDTKTEILVDVMLKKLELEEDKKEEEEQKEAQQEAQELERAEQREMRAERQEARAEKLVNIMETLVNHLTQR